MAKINPIDYRLGAACAFNVLRDLGWIYDPSAFAATCSDPAMRAEVESYSRTSFESDGAWAAFRHTLGFEVNNAPI